MASDRKYGPCFTGLESTQGQETGWSEKSPLSLRDMVAVTEVTSTMENEAMGNSALVHSYFKARSYTHNIIRHSQIQVTIFFQIPRHHFSFMYKKLSGPGTGDSPPHHDVLSVLFAMKS